MKNIRSESMRLTASGGVIIYGILVCSAQSLRVACMTGLNLSDLCGFLAF